MRAITICQPYAHLIALPDEDDRAKRVENRTWEVFARGPLLIHAGKSKAWLNLSDDKLIDVCYGLTMAEMQFGAIVAVCKLADCFHVDLSRDRAERRFPWLKGHQHVEGPFCWVLTEVFAFEEPIPYRGAQGLFNVPDEVVAAAISKVTK